MRIFYVFRIVILFLYALSFSAIAKPPLLILNVTNMGMMLTVGSSDDEVLLSRKLTTLHPPLWRDPPNVAFNDSPIKFLVTMLDDLAVPDMVGGKIRSEKGYVLYISAAGYDAAVNPDDARSSMHKEASFKERIKKVAGKELHEKIEEKGCYKEKFKGDFHACAFGVILEDALAINISTVVIEQDNQAMGAVADKLAEDSRLKKSPALILQATTLSLPYCLKDGNIVSQPLWMPTDDVYDLAYTGGSYEVGSHFKDTSFKSNKKYPDTALLLYLNARLRFHSQYAGDYPVTSDEIFNPEKIKRNNFGRMIIDLSMLPKHQYPQQAKILKLDQKSFQDAVKETHDLIDPVRRQSIISLLCFHHLLDKQERAEIGSILVVDEFSQWLATVDGKDLKALFEESKTNEAFKEEAYKHYKKVMAKSGKDSMSKEDFYSELAAFKFWDVFYAKPEKLAQDMIWAARQRLLKVCTSCL